MRYDLICPGIEGTFYIQCRLDDKPYKLSDLINGIREELIVWQPGHEESCERTLVAACALNLEGEDPILEIDYRTCKPIRHNINWIPTDRS